jgi:predicted O-methyltransferase YrrM
MYRTFFARLFYSVVGKNVQRLDDLYAYPLIRNFLPINAYFPITTSSLGFHALATIINDIAVNSRRNVMEFGAGISTIVLAKYAAVYNEKLRIISVEHDQTYLSIIRTVLRAENLTSYVSFIEASLENQEMGGRSYTWYSREKLCAELGDETLDVVIVDGPISEHGNSMVRYPAIDFVSSRLSANYAIYLDDVHRKGEQVVVTKSRKEYGIRFRKISSTLAVAHRGKFYNPIP